MNIGTMGMQYGGVYRHYENLVIYPGGFGNRQFTADNLRNDVPTLNNMNAYGATGIARAQPLRQQGGLGTAIAELRDLPRLPLMMTEDGSAVFRKPNFNGDYWKQIRDAVRLFKDIGSHYLNFQFGWAALASDIKNAIDNVLKMDARLEQLLRDNGRVIHRSSTIVAEDPKILSKA